MNETEGFVTEEFMKTVQEGKLRRIHIMMKDSLLIDPTAVKFDAMEKYATRQLSIYDDHDGEKLDYDVSGWNEEYLNRQMVVVVDNFSHERIDLLKSMVRYLYKDKVDRIRNEREAKQNSCSVSRKQVGTGVTVAGAALAVAGICTSQTVLTVGGVVVVAAGVALIVSDMGNK